MRYLIILLLFFGCKNSVENTTEVKNDLYEEVMAIHDKVMPETSTIHKVKKELKSIERPENRDIVLSKIKELDDADDDMMAWMAAFKIPEDEIAKTHYLLQEKASIQLVSDQMYTTIKTANLLLDSLKNSN